jgi:type II secretory pathway component PulC
MRQEKTKSFITILNILLLFLMVFIGFNTVEKVLGAHKESATVEPQAAKDNTLKRNTLLLSHSALPDYKAVWERNLFNTSQKALSSPQKQIDLANVVEADKTSGLKLLGTALSDNSKIKSAIIEYHKDQNIYHEGDTAGSYVIKKIFRNSVIVATENGDKLLALKSDYADRGKVALAPSSQTAPKAYTRNGSRSRFRTVELPREEIKAAFDDIDQLIREVRTSDKSGNLPDSKSIQYRKKVSLKKSG